MAMVSSVTWRNTVVLVAGGFEDALDKPSN